MNFTVQNDEEVLKTLVGKFHRSKWRKLGEPLYSRKSIELLSKMITPEFEAFEYGSGMSTVWLRQRVKFLWSVEHNYLWWDRVWYNLDRLYLHQHGNLLLIQDLKQYPKAIETISRSFDIVFIDGRKRVQCIKAAKDKVKHGGYILLDDASRFRYKKVHKILREWERINKEDKRTAIWRRP